MKTKLKSKHGGARPGSGRKPKLQYEARELFYNAVDDRWNTIIAKLDKLITKGDHHTLRWILEQRIGRAPQSLEITNQEEKMTPEQEKSNEELEYLAEGIGGVLELMMGEDINVKDAVERFREWYRSMPLSVLKSPYVPEIPEEIKKWQNSP